MTGRRFSGLFESLEASFEAAGARAEHEAAADLAHSLRQDRLAADVLTRGPWAIRDEGLPPVRIAAVGRDYAETEAGTLLPLDGIRAERSVGPSPTARADSLLERLRLWTREGLEVQVRALDGTYRGRLVSAGRDHLIVRTSRREVLLGYGSVETVSRLRGSSADGL